MNFAKYFYKDKINKYLLIFYQISSFKWLENLGMKSDKLVLSLKLFSDSLNYLVNSSDYLVKELDYLEIGPDYLVTI